MFYKFSGSYFCMHLPQPLFSSPAGFTAGSSFPHCVQCTPSVPTREGLGTRLPYCFACAQMWTRSPCSRVSHYRIHWWFCDLQCKHDALQKAWVYGEKNLWKIATNEGSVNVIWTFLNLGSLTLSSYSVFPLSSPHHEPLSKEIKLPSTLLNNNCNLVFIYVYYSVKFCKQTNKQTNKKHSRVVLPLRLHQNQFQRT